MRKFTDYTPCIVGYEAAMLVGHDIDTGKAYYDSDEVDGEIATLRAQLAESERRREELVEAVRPVAKWWLAKQSESDEHITFEAPLTPDVLYLEAIGTSATGSKYVSVAQLDALAALVGEGK